MMVIQPVATFYDATWVKTKRARALFVVLMLELTTDGKLAYGNMIPLHNGKANFGFEASIVLRAKCRPQ